MGFVLHVGRQGRVKYKYFTFIYIWDARGASITIIFIYFTPNLALLEIEILIAVVGAIIEIASLMGVIVASTESILPGRGCPHLLPRLHFARYMKIVSVSRMMSYMDTNLDPARVLNSRKPPWKSGCVQVRFVCV